MPDRVETTPAMNARALAGLEVQMRELRADVHRMLEVLTGDASGQLGISAITRQNAVEIEALKVELAAVREAGVNGRAAIHKRIDANDQFRWKLAGALLAVTTIGGAIGVLVGWAIKAL